MAAKHPELVRKIILVGSGPFESRYAEGIMKTRLERLSDRERAQARRWLEELEAGNRDGLARFGRLISKADSCDPLPEGEAGVEGRPEVYNGVWPQADALRRRGELLRLAGEIRCPVLAIHGDWDPHPAEGVEKPLAGVIKDFRFLLLKRCGHTPWIEREAKEAFYGILRKELAA
ncbi:MAG: Alpha/beta hydrolase family protein [candidate division TA06 bacterium ADurb.Bin417]|uniref:Alpha/beta hydrolase family protein n=1 Tax=candidate division TA06 bacterium ADurb.Bin417 TaxID=1852828 RepID=A0A1V5MAN2_UNCT6|nr:MAG: Alpha/beta hydrolase family protein [candidate division TA06 bacterium ADurb.Bin417]